jgi:adenylylsulfate kinase-like enzyme
MLKIVLESKGDSVVLLDGDTLRSGLNRDLGFSALDRAENIRRAAEVAKIFCDAGHTVLAAFITPLESLRQAVRGLFRPDALWRSFSTARWRLRNRDPKVFIAVLKGEIPEFTRFHLLSAPMASDESFQPGTDRRRIFGCDPAFPGRPISHPALNVRRVGEIIAQISTKSGRHRLDCVRRL